MKKTPSILLILVLLSFTESKRQKHLYEDANINCSYETYGGRIDGNYISHYKTGQKKAEGKFENNYRIGIWTVWDSVGRIRMQRDYTDPFTFKRLTPEIPNEKPIELLNKPRYSVQKNQDGYINYFDLDERMVVWHKRIWRLVLPGDNPKLFDNNSLFNILNKNILDKKITVYAPEDDEFKKEINLTPDTTSIEIIGYRMKEDHFFDNDRLISESRVVAICPIAIDKTSQDTVYLYWVHFPQIRKYLAKELIQQEGVPRKIKTLDDLFFYRDYYGQIYKESNVSDKPIALYTAVEERDKEAERIEISLIETEHDIWLQFSK